jgi:hypothetical protein
VFGNVMGRGADQLIGRSDGDLFGEQASALLECKREVMTQRKSTRRRLSLAIDGRRRNYDLYVQPTLKVNGEVAGVSGVLMVLEDGQSG